MRSESPLEFLQALKKVLGQRENWTKHVVARDKEHNRLMIATDPAACCWCLTGAVLVVTRSGKFTSKAGVEARNFLVDAMATLHNQYVALSVFNDRAETTYSDIRNLINIASGMAHKNVKADSR